MAEFSKDLLIKKGESGFDARKLAKWIVGAGLLTGVGWVFATFILPFLVTMAWNLVSLGIAAFICGVLFLILTNKRMWRSIGYLVEFLSRLLTFKIIEWDEFMLQEMQIEQAEKDRQSLHQEQQKVEGKFIELRNQLTIKQKNFDLAREAERIALAEGDQKSADEAAREQARNDLYIANVSPIVQDLGLISQYGAKMYELTGEKIQEAKADLQISKDTYTAVKSGSSLLNSAKRIFIGDEDLNSDAEIAKRRVQEKIALSIGEMRVSMQLLDGITKKSALNDKARIALARKRMEEITAGRQVSVTPSILPSSLPSKSGII